MKNFDLESLGVREMTCQEMVHTEGGIIPLIIAGIACVALLSSCSVNVEINNIDSNNTTGHGNDNEVNIGQGNGNG